MNFRNYLFWTIDFLRGKKIKSHLSQLRQTSVGNATVEKEMGLKNMLDHAINTTEFFSKIKGSDISQFPVITKSTIKQNEKEFISKKYNKSELTKVTTSGSTGTPFSIYWNQNKSHRNTADTIFFGEMAGFDVGDKLAYLKIWSSYNHKPWIVRFFQNIICVDVLQLTKDLKNGTSNLLKNNRPYFILGYASAIEDFAKYVSQNPVKNKAKGVVTISESLNEDSRKFISDTLKCRVVSRYSNIENGILAQQFDPNRKEFIANTSSYFFEILHVESDVPVEEGEIGRIVVTDLYNYGMPIIRYDTGDLGSMRNLTFAGRKITVFDKINGRQLDQIFNAKKEPISPFLVYKNMFKYEQIDQYQLIQHDYTKFQIKICSRLPFTQEGQMIQEFQMLLGENVEITVTEEKNIPLLSSGKRKKVMNNMNKSLSV